MTNSNNNTGFTIGVTCPGCGGSLELQEDFHIILCKFCDSVLRLVQPDAPVAYLAKGRVSPSEIRFNIDRYLKKNNLPLSSGNLQIKNLYQPYWKVDAILIKIRNRIDKRIVFTTSEEDGSGTKEVRESETSVSAYRATALAGTAVKGMPIAIGLRADYIKMFPFSKDIVQDNFDVMPITLSADYVLENSFKKFASYGETSVDSVGVNRTELLQPKFSLIYFPFHLIESYDGGYSRFLLDGVTGAILNHNHPNDPVTVIDTKENSEIDMTDDDTSMRNEPEVESEPTQFGNIDVTFHRCTNCGEDLPSRESQLFICRNCQTVVFLEQPLVPVADVRRTTIDNNITDLLFPFWSFKIDCEEHSGRNVFAGLFESDRVVIPAFKMVSFEAIYRLSCRMSGMVPRLNLETVHDVDKKYIPVDLGPNRADGYALAIIYRHVLARNENIVLDDVNFKPLEAELIFAAFHPESYFFVDSVVGAVTFEKVNCPV